eukprot:12689173-Heterocapsa_arctica.AAC.1
MLPLRTSPMPQREGKLGYLQPEILLQMQILTESSAGLRDRGPQGRHYRSYCKMDKYEIMDRGEYDGKDRVYCIPSGNKTM